MILTDYFQVVIIELSKAIEEYKSNKEDGMLQWMMFLDNPEDVEVKKIMENNKEIKEAKNELDKISQDEMMRRILLKEKLMRMDIKQMKKEAVEEGFEKGMGEGIKQGIEEGIKEGKKEGIKKGQIEGEKKEKIEIAKRMLEKDMPIEIIMEVIQLTEKEINEIIKNN